MPGVASSVDTCDVSSTTQQFPPIVSSHWHFNRLVAHYSHSCRLWSIIDRYKSTARDTITPNFKITLLQHSF